MKSAGASLSVTLVLVLTTAAWAQPQLGGSISPSGLFGALAQAQVDDEEPTLPGEGQRPPAAAPGAAVEEPGGAIPGEEPAASGEEPAASGEEPAAPQPAGEPAVPAVTAAMIPAPQASYGAGIHLRGIFVPNWFLAAFLDASTSLNSVAIGGEFIRRKGNFDLVASINFGFYSPEDGNYMGNGKNPADDSDYVQFRDLNLLAFDVAFIWHHDFTSWFSLVYGAGLGFGVLLGDIYRVSNYGCTPENVNDIDQCHPLGMDPGNREQWLANNTGSGPDSATDPHLYREESVWPVVPIVHLLLGVNFKITEQISIRVDGGFHNAFYLGAGSHYFF